MGLKHWSPWHGHAHSNNTTHSGLHSELPPSSKDFICSRVTKPFSSPFALHVLFCGTYWSFPSRINLLPNITSHRKNLGFPQGDTYDIKPPLFVPWEMDSLLFMLNEFNIHVCPWLYLCVYFRPWCPYNRASDEAGRKYNICKVWVGNG